MSTFKVVKQYGLKKDDSSCLGITIFERDPVLPLNNHDNTAREQAPLSISEDPSSSSSSSAQQENEGDTPSRKQIHATSAPLLDSQTVTTIANEPDAPPPAYSLEQEGPAIQTSELRSIASEEQGISTTRAKDRTSEMQCIGLNIGSRICIGLSLDSA
ncbi:hypothetical protein BGX23_006035 [Mortierella sp. AD031]|nr:hypothetical protein BGX23_006035 [Mortierella sp. AD031]KAG0218246.1 hypothetical protein BGX33_008087 [Mortierella sp. NVP41]